MQICSSIQWKFLDKASLFLQGGVQQYHSIRVAFPASDTKKSRDTCPSVASPAHSLDRHHTHTGFCLSYLTVLKRRSRGLCAHDCSLLSKMDHVCLQPINLRVICRQSCFKYYFVISFGFFVLFLIDQLFH